MIVSSAPTKLILFGEHYVVYGAPAVTIPTKPRNGVKLYEGDGEAGIYIKNSMGDGRIRPDWELEGSGYLKGTLATLKKVYEMCNANIETSVKITCIPGGAPKGMGNSASFFAAYDVGLFRYLKKTPTIEQLFECVQEGETVAHGGRPSGIDAITVCKGKPQLFRKYFNPPKFDFRDLNIELPKGVKILVVDTFKRKRESTGDLVSRFAKNKGVGKQNEMSENELKGVYAEYENIFDSLMNELRTDGNAEELGRLFNKNHELLKANGVSSGGIEHARKVALEAGAYGTKLTGAGGEGGAVVCLVDEEKVAEVRGAIEAAGYPSFVVEMDNRGAIVESP